MPITVSRNAAGNCINFIGTTNPAYWNACLSAEVDADDSARINVVNDIRTVSEQETVYEFYKIDYTEFRDADGNSFASAQDCADYITANCNVATNTGQFVLTADDSLDFTLDGTSTSVLLDNGDAYSVNAIRAVGNDDGHIDIYQHTGDFIIYRDLRVAQASIDGSPVTQVQATAVNELNALFSQTGGVSGSAPVITSSSSISLEEGETINYELTATNGVGYEWDLSNVPGVTTAAGNVRRLVGGSGLSDGSYTITAKAVNYFGETSQTITLTVTSTYANTKSVQFNQQDWMGANASLLDGVLGRASNGAGSGDAWTIHMWFKGGTYTSNSQTIFYFGDNDITNSGHLLMRYRGGDKSLRLQYGSSNNYLRWNGADNLLAAGTWKHVVVTYDGGTTGSGSGSVSDYYSRFTVFVDGSDVTSGGTWSNSNYGWSGGIDADNLRVGRYDGGAYMRNSCRIDELAIWDSDQSGNISSLYNSGNTHDLSDLAASPSHWWRMGDGDTYSNILDNVGNAHFVMYNMTAADIVTDAP